MIELMPPVVAYETLEADVAARGLDADDLLRSSGHYDRWRKLNGLTDEDGTPNELFALYQVDPEGAEACPAHASLWHFLLKVGEAFPWIEGPGMRHQTVPVCTAMFKAPEDLTPERIAAGRAKLEAQAGEPIPDDAWTQFEREVRKGPAGGRRCVQEIHELLERHGDAHPQFGRIMAVTLRVSC